MSAQPDPSQPADPAGPASAVLGPAKTTTPTVRALSAYAGHLDCPTAALAMSVRADLDAACADTAYASPYGQDPQAFRRGETFERRVKADDYAQLIELLHEHAGFPKEGLRVVDLRKRAPRNAHGLELRAEETRRLLRQIASGHPEAPNIIDGAVVTEQIAGATAFFEADSVATVHGGRIHVGEIKSFAKVDGRIDPEKLGSACDQAAWYALLVANTLASEGFDPGLVADDGFIITPEGIGLKPTLTRMQLGGRSGVPSDRSAHS